MQFIFPNKNKLYTLEKNWEFNLRIDYINGFIISFLTREGLGSASFDMKKCSIKLTEGTVISVLSFDEKKIIFNIIKFPNLDQVYANLICKVAIKEMNNLFLMDDKKV